MEVMGYVIASNIDEMGIKVVNITAFATGYEMLAGVVHGRISYIIASMLVDISVMRTSLESVSLMNAPSNIDDVNFNSYNKICTST